MAKGKRDYPMNDPYTTTEETLPAGLKELEPEAESQDPKEATLQNGWEKYEDLWINRREFNIPGGVVPQGVVRNTEEAHALETKRCG